jgi:hypothetical protein
MKMNSEKIASAICKLEHKKLEILLEERTTWKNAEIAFY